MALHQRCYWLNEKVGCWSVCSGGLLLLPLCCRQHPQRCSCLVLLLLGLLMVLHALPPAAAAPGQVQAQPARGVRQLGVLLQAPLPAPGALPWR
jgi:hypothetical protein